MAEQRKPIGVDLDRIEQEYQKKKAEAESKNVNFKKLIWWKVPVGDSLGRILPPWTDKGPNAYLYYREIKMHSNIGPNGDRFFRCTEYDTKEPCFLCEEYRRLMTGSPEEKELARTLYASRKAIVNWVLIDDPVWTEEDLSDLSSSGSEDRFPKVGEPKIYKWMFGVTVLTQLLNASRKTKYGDFTNIKTGMNISVNRVGKTKENTEYTVLPIPFHDELDLNPYMDALMNDPTHNLNTLYSVSYEDVKNAYFGIDTRDAKKLNESVNERRQITGKNPASDKKVDQNSLRDDDADNIEAELRGVYQDGNDVPF